MSNNLVTLILGLGVLIGLGAHIKDMGAATVKQDFDDLFKKWGLRHGVEWTLLKALAIVESSLNPNAVNPSDPSHGIMQIFCDAVCQTCPCRNKLNVAGWENATPERLFDPDFNIMIGAQIIKWNIDTYGFKRGIATYNAWSARLDPIDGPFRNQAYVDKVLREWTGLNA